jgi:hypothetical protein
MGASKDMASKDGTMIEDRGENNNNGKTEPTCTKLPGFSE